MDPDTCPDCAAPVIRALTDAGHVMPLEPDMSVGGSYALVDHARPSNGAWSARAIFVYSDERHGPLHAVHRCQTQPQSEAMRLFAPAPNQIPGQLGLGG